MRSLKNFGTGVALTVALFSADYANAGIFSSLFSKFSSVKRYEQMAKSKDINEVRDGLKGLCRLVNEQKVSVSEGNRITDYVFDTFKANASRFRNYPIVRLQRAKDNVTRTYGNRYPVWVSWEKTEDVFRQNKEPVIEACSKMSDRFVRTYNVEARQDNRAVISFQDVSKLYDRQNISPDGKTLRNVLEMKDEKTGSIKYKPRDNNSMQFVLY